MRLAGTRQAIHDALAWGWTQKGDMGFMEWVKYECRIARSVKQNNDYRIQDMTEAGYILAAISLQKAPIASWLTYCYGIEDREFDRLEVTCTLFESLFLEVQSIRKLQRHRSLCEVAVDDYKLRVRRTKHLPIEAYGVGMKVDISHWSRDWRRKQDLCLDRLKSYDAMGVSQVSRIVRALREEEESASEILQEMRA